VETIIVEIITETIIGRRELMFEFGRGLGLFGRAGWTTISLLISHQACDIAQLQD